MAFWAPAAPAAVVPGSGTRRCVGGQSSCVQSALRRRLLLRSILFLLLSAPAAAAYGSGKKSKFMSAYPVIFKFVLFWWCVIVFIVMGFYIADHLMFRRFGPAKVDWRQKHSFKGGCGRDAVWKQFADPSAWSPDHPILQSADIRMVSCSEKAGDDCIKKTDKALSKAEEYEENDELSSKLQLRPVQLGPLRKGLGLVLRHKEGNGPRAGSFFCTRECVECDKPADAPWRFVMKTIEGGNGYPYDDDSEVTEVEVHSPNEDGSVDCVMTGSATTRSRIFRWWNSLQPNSVQGAANLMQTIEERLLSSKKRD